MVFSEPLNGLIQVSEDLLGIPNGVLVQAWVQVPGARDQVGQVRKD